MNAPSQPGRCILVDTTAADAERLTGLPQQERISATDLETSLDGAAGPVDLVVIGSGGTSPRELVQRVHRLVPDAGIAVLTAEVAGVRRQMMFAPGVPLDLLVAAVDEDDLGERLQRLRQARIERRRNAGMFAAVARAAAAPGTVGPGPAAVGPLLEHAPIAVLVASPAGKLLGWNRRAEVLLNLDATHRGQQADDVLPGAAALLTSAGSSIGSADPARAHPPLPLRVAGGIDAELSAVHTQTDQGRPVVLLLAVDVSARRQAEQARDRLAGQVQLLGRISESLMLSLEPSEALSWLAAALVPELADWASIQVREEDERVYDVVVRHRDPDLRGVAREVERVKSQRGVLTGPSRRAADGHSVLLPQVGEEGLVEQVPDPELRGLVQRLGMGSVIAAPIPGRAGLHGSVLLVNTPGGNSFSETDLSLAVEIGRRTGIALDNARLYAGQRHVATELQQSLLTAPPTVPFADIAVRYVAAARQAQVGGDWYDAFRRRNGDLIIVVGDVAGHDTRAAADMGQLRGLLRGIGYTAADTPGRLLSGVDEAIEGLQLATMATAVLAELSPPDGGRTGGLPVRWSNAGHPPPLLLDPQGQARLLGPETGKADLLLGVDPATPRATEQTTLPVGATLLLYTDGLIERRGESLDDGLARLQATVQRHANDDLDQFCDAIVNGMVAQESEDDVAILAVRSRSVALEQTQRR